MSSKAEANKILEKHGPAGWMVRTLQRYALLGWGLAFFVLFMHFLIILISTFSPRPVVAVDSSGRVLGSLEYLKPESRSDEEILAASMRFASRYMSINSETIYEDYSEAMNMMGPELLATTNAALKDENYLARVAAAKMRSRLEFASGDGVRVVSRQGLSAVVRLSGNIVVEGGSEPINKPFDITLETEAVARNTSNTSGLVILTRRDN